MWPSFEVASRLYNWANISLIVTLVFGAASTVVVVWMGNVKEAYLNRDIASLELQAEQLRKLAGPRTINQEVFLKELADKPKLPVDIWYLPDISDGVWLMNQVTGAIIAAKWQLVGPPTPIAPNVALPPSDPARFIPPLMAMGAQPTGVTVLAHGVPADIDKMGPAQTALMRALAQAMGSSASASFSATVPEGTLRIVIAAKPDPILSPTDR